MKMVNKLINLSHNQINLHQIFLYVRLSFVHHPCDSQILCHRHKQIFFFCSSFRIKLKISLMSFLACIETSLATPFSHRLIGV